MSAGGVKSIGVISEVEGWGCVVQSAEHGESRHDFIFGVTKPRVGQQVILFDAMEHDHTRFGHFYLAATTQLDIVSSLDLHSINVLVHQEHTHLGTIHIDPFTSMPNYDEFELRFGKEKWSRLDFPNN